VTSGWNSLIYFITIDEYASAQPYFNPDCGCLAHVFVWGGANLNRMEAWIGTEQSAAARRHQIREEMI